VHLTLGHHDKAAGYYEQAYGVFGDLDRRGDQARVLTNLGDAEQAFGATQAAVDAWQRAIAIFDELQHPGAELARGKLRDLGWPGAAGHARAKNGHHPAGA
jgi:tetratricopeptide (TPR) repeat protein